MQMNSEPTAEDLKSPEFDAVWNTIKEWDIDRGNHGPDFSVNRRNYSNATGTDVMSILNALKRAGLDRSAPERKKETELLQVASGEIKTLRQQNQAMAGRLDMFDKMMVLFSTQPFYASQGMSEDIAWKIDRHLEQK